jgi:protein-disulfide isomerase
VSKKAWIIFGAICVIVLGGLIFLSSRNRINVDDIDANAVVSATERSGNIGDHVFGKTDSKVVLIEYGDFQCPGCGGAHPTVKELTEKYKDKMAFVFRNFPIATLHPNARAAAATAEAAGLQGKYWEMHNKLFKDQFAWQDLSSGERDEFFLEYAKEFKLNEEKFKTDFTSSSVNQKINFDTALGKKVDVSVTPTFFLDGKKLEQDIQDEQGNIDPEKFEKTLTDTMREKGIELDQ